MARDFKRYNIPKIGVFSITTDEYKFPNGWASIEEYYTIIGETDEWYIYRLQECGYGEWVGGKVIEHTHILPIGIHKTRLVKWLPIQLSLFS